MAGNDVSQADRQRIAGNPSNLRLKPLALNRSKSAEGFGYRQKWWAGRNFTGPGSGRGSQWAHVDIKFANFI